MKIRVFKHTVREIIGNLVERIVFKPFKSLSHMTSSLIEQENVFCTVREGK